MYAACSFVVGKVASAQATDFARVWVWVALAVWALVATGLVRAIARALGHALERQASSGRPA